VTTNNGPTKRTLGREYAFKFIYKHLLSEFNDEKLEILDNQEAMNDALTMFDKSFIEEDIEHPDNLVDFNTKIFAKELIIGSLKNELANSKLIEKYLTNQKLHKVDRMNLAVLLLGAYEILNTIGSPTPAGVVINEYVNVAKKYCPNDSHGFVNSVLDKIAKGNN
jgi:N utilization substance protein B